MDTTTLAHTLIALAGIAAATVLAALGKVDGSTAIGVVSVLVGVSGGVAATTIGRTPPALPPGTTTTTTAAGPPVNPFVAGA